MAHNRPIPTKTPIPRKSIPTKTPTPPGAGPMPSPVPEAPKTAVRRSRLAAHRRDVATSFQTVLGEATPSQRTLLKGVEPRAVESIGTVGGRAISGRTFFPAGSKATRVIQRGLQTVGVLPKSGIEISAQGRDPTLSKVRHETAHAVLFKQGVGPKQQHPILDRARVRKDNQIDLPSLKTATKFKTGTAPGEKMRGFNMLRKRRAAISKRK